jgi:hypothetical protein
MNIKHKSAGEMLARLGTISTFLLLVPCSCSSDDGGEDVSAAGSAFVGIYQIDDYTRNSSGCDIEGPSVKGELSDGYLFLDLVDVLGSKVVSGASCGSVASCREFARAQRDMEGYGPFELSYAFDRPVGENLAGTRVSTGMSGSGNTCTEASVEENTARLGEGGALRIEQRAVVVDHAVDGDGYCTTEGTKAAAAGKPCSRYETLTLTFVEAL